MGEATTGLGASRAAFIRFCRSAAVFGLWPTASFQELDGFSSAFVGLPPQWQGSTGGRSIGSKPLQEPERRCSLREVDLLICLFPFLLLICLEAGLITGSSGSMVSVTSPESTFTSTSRLLPAAIGSSMLSLLPSFDTFSTLLARMTILKNWHLRLYSLQARWMMVAALFATWLPLYRFSSNSSCFCTSSGHSSPWGERWLKMHSHTNAIIESVYTPGLFARVLLVEGDH